MLQYFFVEIVSCSVSDFAYCDAFLRSVVCLSVVCHIRAPCLDRLKDLHATWQVVVLWGAVTLCVRWASGKGRFGD